MCLITEQNVPFTAQEDIVVFKRVLRYEEYIAPMYGYVYKLNKETEEVGVLAKIHTVGSWPDPISSRHYQNKSNLYEISRGYHTSSLSHTIDLFKKRVPKSMHILKCIIPKGSQYFKDAVGNYTSSKLIPLEKVTNDVLRIVRKENWPLSDEEMHRLEAKLLKYAR